MSAKTPANTTEFAAADTAKNLEPSQPPNMPHKGSGKNLSGTVSNITPCLFGEKN
jgi:hypothetical protein